MTLDAHIDGSTTTRFSIKGVIFLTAIIAIVMAFLSAGFRVGSPIYGYGLICGTSILFCVALYLASRFTRRPGVSRRFIYFAFIAIAIFWLLVVVPKIPLLL